MAILLLSRCQHPYLRACSFMTQNSHDNRNHSQVGVWNASFMRWHCAPTCLMSSPCPEEQRSQSSASNNRGLCPRKPDQEDKNVKIYGANQRLAVDRCYSRWKVMGPKKSLVTFFPCLFCLDDKGPRGAGKTAKAPWRCINGRLKLAPATQGGCLNILNKPQNH